MNLRGALKFFGLMLASLLVLVGCGGSGASATPSLGSKGEELAFDQASLTVPAGQQITVTFKNSSTGQQHNWVLANGGDDVAAQVDEAATANGGDATGVANVIANTALLSAGQQGTAQFAAPPAGEYTYLCTFPGHYVAGMKGKLSVK